MSISCRLAPIIAVVATCASLAAPAAERTQEYPWKTVRMVVPFAPGGGADLNARLLGPRLSDRLGQPFVADNRPAAGGIVGNEIAAKSTPDGHTLLIATSTLASAPAIHKKLPYDVLRDFAPVALTVNSPLVVVVHPSVPVKSMQELIAHARANPNKLNYGITGMGGPPHIAGELLKSMTKIEIVPVLYKGIGPVLSALLGNEVQLTFSNTFVAQPHIKAGRMRALAVTSPERSQAAPDLPTVIESGLPGYTTGIWFGVLAPAGTPKPVIARLNREIVAILRTPEISQMIVAQGGDVVASTPEGFGKILRDETARLGKVIREAGIKPE
jgi:tripartite-type tricarboxylate transporter receptor subunit TctC